MTQPIHFRLKAAYDVHPGQLILRTGEAGVEICVKAERKGKDFVRHYLVPLSPLPPEGASLVYLDPEEEVATCAGQLRIILGEAKDVPVASGIVFSNAKGTHLRAEEHSRFHGHKALGYLDMVTGEVRSRQEKGITAVHPDWRVDGVETERGGISLDDLRDAFAASSAS